MNQEKKNINAWLLRLGQEATLSNFSVTIEIESNLMQGVQEGDGLLIVNQELQVVAFARVFRRRSTLNDTTFYFDGRINVNPNRSVGELGITSPSAEIAISRIEWPIFEAALKKACGIEYSAFPVLTGSTTEEQAYIRQLLQDSVTDDLLGPANGPMEEIIGMSVRDRYLVGKLAPMSPVEDVIGVSEAGLSPDEEGESSEVPDDLIPCANPDHISRDKIPNSTPDEEGEPEIDTSKSRSLVPSSFGFTFCVDSSVENIEVQAKWGRYERGESEKINEKTGKAKRAWKRIPSGGTTVISLNKAMQPVAIDSHSNEVLIQGSVSDPLANGDRLVTLFLVNGQSMPKKNQDMAWIFQPELIARDPENKPIFRRRPVLNTDGSDKERESLEMIYRKQVEFAVGHGVSVHAITADGDDEHAVEVRTCILPQYEIPVTETPGLANEDRPAMKKMVEQGFLDMEKLAQLERSELISTLSILIDDYAAWIDEQKARIGNDVNGYDISANDVVDRCGEILERLREGISVLGSDDNALEAFRFANLAMASQRIRSIYALLKRRGDNISLDTLDIPKNRSWRPFQLAFILLSIPALADPMHKDRTQSFESYADLLWFPTGGGKTEAYLGVAAFTMAIRRLHGEMGGLNAARGLAVIMRYTLRLLTIQQFQRATTLICAMEAMRQSDIEKWGTEPFSIGLWVGQRVTPNTTEESHAAVEKERDGQYGTGSTPAQLTNCPWCGSEIAPGREITVDRNTLRSSIYCGDKFGKCEFSRAKSKGMGLPVLVVDDEIYRRPPSMLIATVDKFAMMAWRGQVRTLFGKASHECDRHGLLWPEGDCNGNHHRKGDLPPTSVQQVIPIRPPDLIIQDEFHLISGPLGTMVGLYETAVDELSTWECEGKAIRPKIIASTATVRKADEQVKNVFLRRVAVFPPHGLDVEDNFFSVQRSIEGKPGRRYMGICSLGSSRPAVLIRVYVALLTAAQSLFEKFGQAADPYMTVVGYFNSLRELGGMRRLAEDDVQTRSYRVQMSEVDRPGLVQRSIKIVD